MQGRLREQLAVAPTGPLRIISLCAGEGRDVIGVLSDHPRRADVRALLVEVDPGIVELARAAAARAGLSQIDVVEGDAASSDIYMRWIPADVVLACGILGNISDAEVANTVRNLSMLCRKGAAVIWTRHRLEPDLTPQIRQWFVEGGFEELSFDAPDNPGRSGIGTVRLVAAPLPFQPAFRFFTMFTR